MLPTPSTSHVSFTTIYEPAEDSFLLLDTLSSNSETTWLKSRLSSSGRHHKHQQTPLVVEVGAGSGVVIAFLTAHASRIFGTAILALGLDVNRDACMATAVTVEKASAAAVPHDDPQSIYLSSICGDLVQCILPHSVDVLVFNPPYVPTESLPAVPGTGAEVEDDFERASHLLSLAYAGGRRGMETTDRLLEMLPAILSERGVGYVLLCRQNGPEEVKERIRGWDTGWHAETVGSSGMKAGWEKLQVIRIWRE